jgi:hypothetical protein
MNIELNNEINSVLNQQNKPNKDTLNLTAEKFKEMVKKEVYETFAEAGYGKIVDGKFIPKKPFYGAEIQEGEEHRYKPVAPFE